MQQRQLDRILNRFDGGFLSPDFRPRQFRHVIEIMFVRTGRRHHLQRHDFGGEIGETGQPDGREYSEPEGKRGKRHRFGQSAHRVEVE